MEEFVAHLVFSKSNASVPISLSGVTQVYVTTTNDSAAMADAPPVPDPLAAENALLRQQVNEMTTALQAAVAAAAAAAAPPPPPPAPMAPPARMFSHTCTHSLTHSLAHDLC